MSLVGRDVPLTRIQRLLADARDARSSVLALRGAAGIGKSVLLDHAVSIAETEGMQVVRGAGTALTRDIVKTQAFTDAMLAAVGVPAKSSWSSGP